MTDNIKFARVHISFFNKNSKERRAIEKKAMENFGTKSLSQTLKILGMKFLNEK